MLNALAVERDAANARADQARDAALVEALSACKQVAETAREYSLPQMVMGANKCHDDISDLRIHAHAILALRAKPAPAVTVQTKPCVWPSCGHTARYGCNGCLRAIAGGEK